MTRRFGRPLLLGLALGLPAGLVAAHVAPLVSFSDGTVANAATMNANFEALRAAVEAGPPPGTVGAAQLATDAASLAKVSGNVVQTNGTNVGVGGAPGTAKLSVNGTVRATTYTTDCAQTVKLATSRTYTTLNTQLDADTSGVGVCGTGWHVCNYQEATVYGVLLGCDLGGVNAWIVGGFSNGEAHRRAMWNSQDSVQCTTGNFPAWWGRWGPYLGRIHCEAASATYPVACCVTR